jgi:hypothetical protein
VGLAGGQAEQGREWVFCLQFSYIVALPRQSVLVGLLFGELVSALYFTLSSRQTLSPARRL